MRRTVSFAVAFGGTALVVVLLAAQASTRRDRGGDGGVFRMNVSNSDVRFVDPALASDGLSAQVVQATCGHLLYYPDRNGLAGTKVTPEIAAGMPRVSQGGRDYTFRVRTGFRFNTGEPVTPASFVRAFERALTPKMAAYAANFLHDVVGAERMLAGKDTHVAGIRVQGDRLTVRLTHTAPDFLARLTLPALCAVPAGLPADPLGVALPPAAGPYYVAKRVVGRSLELVRNPYYAGPRPHHVDRIVITVNSDPNQSLLQVEKGEADYDAAPLPSTAHARLAEKYGINRRRYHVTPFLETDYIALNASRPAFADANVRRAVNYALDRRFIAQQFGGGAATPTDQILPPGMPGFRDAHIYPLAAPDVARAKELMAGKTFAATLYAIKDPTVSAIALIVQKNLRAIGIDVTIRTFPFGAFLGMVGAKAAPFDMTLSAWGADYPDPFDFINVTLGAGNITPTENVNLAHFDDPGFQRRMTAAAHLTGAARSSAYARLDADLMRQVAPWAPLENRAAREFVSARVRCYVAQPVYAQLDLAAVCLDP